MEQEKISALVEENMKTIFAYALSRVSHKEDAEDLAGDIILAILRSAPRIRDGNAFFGYIWAIAANTYKKYLYKKNRISYEALGEEIPDAADFTRDILQAEQMCTLRRELALLSGEYRECTLAYYFQGLSCAETAARLHISLEMVKYYLFKTRKILKEGISMEREFGTKSYQPAKFEFNAIFFGNANMEYQKLFDRKLPGNILVSAYYTPMAIRQLAIELGVASVYLEDEIAVLEKYGLLTALPGGKYQTRLILFTEEFLNEFYRTAEQKFAADVKDILANTAKKLPRLRELQFIGSGLDDNTLLWDLFFELFRHGHDLFKSGHKQSSGMPALYSHLDGVCYGSTYDFPDDYVYETASHAGYCRIKGCYAASFADFRILPGKNRFTAHLDDVKGSLDAVLSGQADTLLPIVMGNQKDTVLEILRDEISAFARLYGALHDCACSVLQVHAPESVSTLIDQVMSTALFFKTVGFLGVCAVRAGALSIPEDDRLLGGFLYAVE